MTADTGFVDAYAVLDVDPDASQEELRAAHRRLVRLHHPDIASPDERERATRRTQQLNLAYWIVSDPARRARYDAVRAQSHRAELGQRAAREWAALVHAAGRWTGRSWQRHGLSARDAGYMVGRVLRSGTRGSRRS